MMRSLSSKLCINEFKLGHQHDTPFFMPSIHKAFAVLYPALMQIITKLLLCKNFALSKISCLNVPAAILLKMKLN